MIEELPIGIITCTRNNNIKNIPVNLEYVVTIKLKKKKIVFYIGYRKLKKIKWTFTSSEEAEEVYINLLYGNETYSEDDEGDDLVYK